MAWSTSNYFPEWGDSGERPSDGFQYDGGDQVNEKHLDYFLNALDEFEDDVWTALEDIDSDGDGVVDDSDQFAGTAPSDGSSGQFLQTDGSSTAWEDAVTALSELIVDEDKSLEGHDLRDIRQLGVDRVEGQSYVEAVSDITADDGAAGLDLWEANWFEVSVTSDLTANWEQISESTLSGDTSTITSVQFSHDESLMIFTYSGGGRRMYNTSDWSLKWSVNASGAHDAEFSPDDELVAVGEHDGVVDISETDPVNQIEYITTGTGEEIEDIDFSPDGEYLAVGTFDTVFVYETSGWTQVESFGGGTVNAVSFSPSGRYIAYGLGSNTYVRRTRDWAEISQSPVSGGSIGSTVQDVAFSDSGEYLGSAHFDDDAYIVETEGWTTEATLASGTYDGEAITFSEGDAFVALCTREFGGSASEILVYNTSDWTQNGNFTSGSIGSVTSRDVSFSNGYLAYSGGSDVYIHRTEGIYFAPPGDQGTSFTVYFEDADGNGPYTLSWPSNVLWPGGNAVTEVPQGSNIEIGLTSPDGGDTWRATERGSNWQ